MIRQRILRNKSLNEQITIRNSSSHTHFQVRPTQLGTKKVAGQEGARLPLHTLGAHCGSTQDVKKQQRVKKEEKRQGYKTETAGRKEGGGKQKVSILTYAAHAEEWTLRPPFASLRVRM